MAGHTGPVSIELQEAWVLFVEIGATDGVVLSNSFLLEKFFHWDGILVEPAKKWHHALQENRSCNICHDCAWSESNHTLTFNEVPIGELSTLHTFSGNDTHAKNRKKGIVYPVKTISLNDLLVKYEAPAHIDYLSIDTEGSEFDILSTCDFNRFHFSVITCEHNYTESREKIYRLLTQNGYKRILTQLSQFDDWYVKT